MRYDARMARRSHKAEPVEAGTPRWIILLLPVTLLLVEIVVLPGAHSGFRLPKEALAAGGLALVTALGLGWALYQGKLRLPSGVLARVLAAYPLLLALSALWASSWRHALAAAAIAAVWTAAALWIASLDEQQRRLAAWWAAAGVAISAATMLLQAAGVRALQLTAASERGRLALTGRTGNPADLAMAATLVLPFLLCGDHPRETPWARRVRWALIVILAAATAASQSLTGLVALGLIAATWTWLKGSRRLRLAAAGAVAALLVVALAAGLGARLAKQVEHVRSGDWYSLLSSRTDGWSAAVEMARQDPLLGVGAAQFDRNYFPSRLEWLERHQRFGRRGELATHFEWAHCDPLQLAAELGLLGVVWLAAVVVALLRGRQRRDPLPLLAAAAFTPFALLHYPTHLAASLVPIVLVLAHVLASGSMLEARPRPATVRLVSAVALLGLAAVMASWQVARIRIDLWRGDTLRILQTARQSQEPQRSTMAREVERQSRQWLTRASDQGGWLWQIIGHARTVRGDAAGAEAAFQRAVALWPHGEAELGLGLALAAQGRTSEAVTHLGRVFRVNRVLLRMIEDPDVRRALQQYVDRRSRQLRRQDR